MLTVKDEGERQVEGSGGSTETTEGRLSSYMSGSIEGEGGERWRMT